ncbi:MAG: alpha/beta hydrolase, partial [Rhodobacteraceae bacterium]|nr:alpha/beta hydrolase [Paracoccaceae bacterium]
MEPAPFFADIAEAPAGGRTVWATAADGVRLRIGYWRGGETGERNGTVLIFPGRSEYIEKYGPALTRLTGAGHACLIIDWRGQGLSDRILADPMSGHVHEFVDYQTDVAALLQTA